jgi:menaquinol-cytochrome c reductase cytochrome b/c subunit
MVATTPDTVASQAVRQKARRQRDDELLVWPDLVFIEFIAAMVFLLAITALSIAINAPLLDRANPAVTPNPSKAPWYFLNLQELLLHMDPALAGVVVPTVALIALGAIPYYDRDNEGQGEWLSTPNAWRLTWIGSIVGSVGSLLLIAWDAQLHVRSFVALSGSEWPSALNFLRNARAIQNDLPWPEALRSIPLGNILRLDLLGLPAADITLNIPELIVAQILPVSLMIGLPIIFSIVLWKTGEAKTRRDHMIAQFSGFIATYIVLTIIGTAFRGQGMELMLPWQVKMPIS